MSSGCSSEARCPLRPADYPDSRRVIRQNLAFAASVIAMLITLTFVLGLRLAVGVVGHEGSTVLVVLNGLRLLGSQPSPS